jgi:prepilin-type N-terminal cleavage/methylation domain-containing protein
VKRTGYRGFSLLELMIVTAILVTVFAIVMGYISTAQRRFDTEETKMDMTQESREFMDYMARDLHMVGNPHPRMFAPGVLGNPWYNHEKVAAGLVALSPTLLRFQGDVDNNGIVDNLSYELVPDFPAGDPNPVSCPCRIRRYRRDKVGGMDPMAQPQPFQYVATQDVINSGGTIPLANLPGNLGVYAAEPVFRAYDASGTEIALPLDYSTAAGQAALATIRSIRVTLNVLGPVNDNQTGVRPVITMSTTARINNY